jgi:soluble lytic murein transglycosylase-like protein
VNLHDVRQNVRAGVVLLHHYLVRYHGNRTLALAAYYQGQRAVDLHGVYAETRPYVAAILAVADRLR